MSALQLTVLYDGACPLCNREIQTLTRLDRGRGRLAAVDIAAPDFDASRYARDLDTLMGRIHGVRPDGEIIEGVEVFRCAYAAVGLGWLLAWTRWPGLRSLSDVAYAWFARNRLRLTGRGAACAPGRCRVAHPARSSERAGRSPVPRSTP